MSFIELSLRVRGDNFNLFCNSKPKTCCGDSVKSSQDETILFSAHKSVWNGKRTQCPIKEGKSKVYISQLKIS